MVPSFDLTRKKDKNKNNIGDSWNPVIINQVTGYKPDEDIVESIQAPCCAMPRVGMTQHGCRIWVFLFDLAY